MLRLSVVVGALLVPVIGQATADEAEPQDILTPAEQSLELLDQIDQANKEGDTGKVAELVAAIRKAMTANWVRLPSKRQNVEHAHETPPTVKGHLALIEYQCDPLLLSTAGDIWLAVVPLSAPDQLWFQGSALITNTGQTTAYVGTEGKLPRSEQFQVLLVKTRAGQFEKPVAIKTADIKPKGIVILASTIIERVE